MKIFFDTEFQEALAVAKFEDIGAVAKVDVSAIIPISLGFVKENGEELYRPLDDILDIQLSPWVLDNVGKHLEWIHPKDSPSRTRGYVIEQVRRDIVEFCGDSPEFWADYGAYDWVTLCQLFGTMMDLPKGWPMFVRDFQQFLEDQVIWTGDPEDLLQCVPRQLLETEGPKQDPDTLHHALHDARHLKAQYDFIQSRL